MAAIPSSGAITDYYRRRVNSTSSNTSCGSSEYAGEVIPHPPGLQRRDSGHWWSSFFFPKPENIPGGVQNGSEPVMNGSYAVVNGQVTCIAREMIKQQRRQSESSESGKFEASTLVQPSTPPPTTPTAASSSPLSSSPPSSSS